MKYVYNFNVTVIYYCNNISFTWIFLLVGVVFLGSKGLNLLQMQNVKKREKYL